MDFTQELGNLVRFHGELANEEGVTSPVASVGTVDLLDHLVEGHGVRVVAQPLEGIAVGLRQKIGAVRRQLADLHTCS